MPKRIAARLTGRLAASLAACLALGAALPAGAQQVRTDKGAVTGVADGATTAWLGIPYAAPPVGDLRFRPPQAAARWTTPLAVNKLPSACMQPTPQGTNGSEDCLYLSVWSAAKAGAKLPVMVYFHGGAFQIGAGSLPVYNGASLAQTANSVVVTVNYRLNVLGFLAAPALDRENPHHVSGNYGLMDQQAALRWVRRNIAGFGGNPANVTIVGESAGAQSVMYHLVSPLSAGLFTRAILQSNVENAANETLAVAEAGKGAAVVEKVGCAGPADVAACLRAVPAAKLAVAGVIPGSATGAGYPVQDGHVLPRQPIDALQSGHFNRVPTILGSNHDEWTAFVWRGIPKEEMPLTADGYTKRVTAMFRGAAPAVLAAYPVATYSSPLQALAAVNTDFLVACPTSLARVALARFTPVWGYELNEPDPAHGNLLGPAFPNFVYGDYHTADVPYVFGVSTPDGAALAGKDAALSRKVQGWWGNLAHSGDPNRPVAQVPTWPGFGHSQALLDIKDVPGLLAERDFEAAHHCGLWNHLPKS